MTQEPAPCAENGAVDERIRRLATELPCGDRPAEIESRVLGKVRRRRRLMRAGYAGAAVAVLTMAGLASLWLFEPLPVNNQLASETTGAKQSVELKDVGLTELDSRFLADPPPVISLGVIAEHQFATLNCLEAIAEEVE